MIIKKSKKESTRKRHRRVRIKLSGTKDRPRLCIYKSNKHLYAQLVDDISAHTLLSCSTLEPGLKKDLKATWSIDAAKKIGETVATKAKDKGIKKVLFDRGGNKYHGKILAFAEAARSGGLEF